MEAKNIVYYSSEPNEPQAIFPNVSLNRDEIPNWDKYPFSIPAIQGMEKLELHPKVTFLVGENGSGKSTLIEGIAVKAGFNPEGGSRDFNFSTRASHSELYKFLELSRPTRKINDWYFLRAESFYNVSTEIENLRVSGYGPKSLHEQSHGEAFLALAMNRFKGRGFYIMDEPESALSPARQIALLYMIHKLVHEMESQIIISTHSPILLAYPESRIYQLSDAGIHESSYEETEHFRITHDFLQNRETYMRNIMQIDQGTLDL